MTKQLVSVVLYTYDYEPITILELPHWVLEHLEQHGRCLIAVNEPFIGSGAPAAEQHYQYSQPKTIEIRCEYLSWRDGSKKAILMTSDEELALALKPGWLPGQRQAVRNYESQLRIASTIVQRLATEVLRYRGQ